MTQSLPSRPSLEHLKNQAKGLLRAVQVGEPAALARWTRDATDQQSSANELESHVTESKREYKLADAQRLIAREYGFNSWAQLKQHVEWMELDRQSEVERFNLLTRYCLEGELDKAERLLERFPQITSYNLVAASLVGDLEMVQGMIARDPSLVTKNVGKLNAQPIVYACSTRFARPSSPREPQVRAVVQELLQCGADANAYWLNPDFGYCRLPALYGACGVNGNVAIAQILLEAGAKPDDNESLYHSVEHEETSCTKLLLEYGALISGTNAVHNAVGLGNIDAVRMFLQHGADVNEPIRAQRMMTLLHWAIACNQDREMLELLITHGADLKAVSGDGITPFRRAVASGHRAAIDVLRERGVSEELTPHETFLAACMSGAVDEARQILDTMPQVVADVFEAHPGLLNAAAWHGNLAAIQTLLAVGFNVASGNEHGATALHAAAWHAHRDIVQLLLQHGAPLDVIENEFQCTPLEWTLHGSCNCRPRLAPDLLAKRGEIYAEITRLLIDAGSPRPVDRLVRVCRGPVEEVLATAGVFAADEL